MKQDAKIIDFPNKRIPVPFESLQVEVERLEGTKMYLLKRLEEWQEYAHRLERELDKLGYYEE